MVCVRISSGFSCFSHSPPTHLAALTVRRVLIRWIRRAHRLPIQFRIECFADSDRTVRIVHVCVMILGWRRRRRADLIGSGRGAAAATEPGPHARVAGRAAYAVRRMLNGDWRAILTATGITIVATPPRLRATTCKTERDRVRSAREGDIDSHMSKLHWHVRLKGKVSRQRRRNL